ncbi:uncharacterized protein TNCV_505581 [Trichonephila clavipes]|nr:uncharacterized protein TNCV_505581 [Trichonephila clavipes]
MRYDRALRHTGSVCCLETFRSIFAVTLPLVRSNSWDAQLTVPNDPRCARLETNLGIRSRAHCKTKAGLRRSRRGLYIRTRLSSLLRLNLDSSLKTTWFHSAASFYSDAVQFPRAWHHSKRMGVKGSTRNERRDLKCPSARRLRMAREDTRYPSKGATCAWMAADESVVCTRAFLTIWRSSRRLICRGRHEPSLHVNDICRIHWSKYLLTTQSELPN